MDLSLINVYKVDEKVDSLQVICHPSIHSVDPVEWEKQNATNDFFHSYAFIRLVEDANLRNSRFWYLLFYKEGKLVGNAVLSSFSLNLNHVLERKGKGLLKPLKRFFPSLIKAKLLVCGLPVSFGGSSIRFSKEASKAEVLECLHRQMERIATDNNIPFLCFRELKEVENQEMESLEKLGFFKADSTPDIRMRVGKQRKSKVKRSTEEKKDIELRYNAWDQIKPKWVYQSYLKEVYGSGRKVEILNLSFFDLVFERMQSKMDLVSLYTGSSFESHALLLQESPNSMRIVLIGQNNNYSEEEKAYFYQQLERGIQRILKKKKIKQVIYGQRAFSLKNELAGNPVPKYFYLKASNSIYHFFLKYFFRFFLSK